ncbi:TPA: hypothetical protein ACM6YT_004835, partial [Escherichia coli]
FLGEYKELYLSMLFVTLGIITSIIINLFVFLVSHFLINLVGNIFVALLFLFFYKEEVVQRRKYSG